MKFKTVFHILLFFQTGVGSLPAPRRKVLSPASRTSVLLLDHEHRSLSAMRRVGKLPRTAQWRDLLLASASSHCLFKGEPFFSKTIIRKNKTSETTRLRRCPTSNRIGVISRSLLQFIVSTLKQRPPSPARVPVPWPLGSLHSEDLLSWINNDVNQN